MILGSGWRVEKNAAGTACVYPLNDFREHDIDGPCWCRPFDDEGILVHNSMDGRERYEEGRKPS